MPQRRCLDCPAIIDAPASRCPTHELSHRPPGYTQAARAHVLAHPACVWCGTTDDLTAGHLVPGDASAGFRTECRTCGNQQRYGTQPGGAARDF